MSALAIVAVVLFAVVLLLLLLLLVVAVGTVAKELQVLNENDGWVMTAKMDE